MAQVKKYQQGGKFIKDGQEFTADDNFFRQLDSYSQSLDDSQRLHLADVRDALQRGETVTYDSYRNELSPNVNFSNISDRQNQRLEKRPTRTGAFFDALFNTGRQQGAKTISALRDFNITQQSTPQSLKELRFSRANIDYNTGENGERIFSNNPANQDIIDRIGNLIDYYSLGDEGKNMYKVSGINDDAVRSFHEKNPDRLSNILSNIQNSSLNEEDWDILNSLNIFDTEPSKAVQSAESTQIIDPVEQRAQQRQQLASANGFDNNLLSKYGINLVQDENGNIIWEDATNDWYLGGFEAFKGTPYEEGVVYNGRLFTPEQVKTNQDVTNRFRGFYNAWTDPSIQNYNDRFELAASGDIGFVGNDNNPFSITYNPNEEYIDTFQDYFGNLPEGQRSDVYNIADLTGYYDIPEGDKVLTYVGNKSEKNYLGIPKPTTVWYQRNPQNGSSFITENIDDMLKQREGFYTPDQLRISNWETKGGNKYGLWKTFNIADGGENYIYVDPSGKKYLKSGKTYKPLSDESVNKIINESQTLTRQDLDRLTTDSNWTSVIEKANQSGRYNSSGRQSFLKEGGKIPVFQFGGAVQQAQPNIQKTVSSGLKGSISESAKLKDVTSQGSSALTSSDKWQLGAIAGDLGALIASLPTGGNAVAAGVGAGSTIAQFVSDVKRDGLDWGDVGRGLGSLGLDALTLIPGAGIAAKSAKTIKLLKRSSRLLGGAFAAYGLGAAGTSLAKLTKEGDANDWTIDDLRNIAVGIQSVIGGKRLLLDKRLATQKVAKPKAQKVDSTVKKRQLVDNKLKNDAELAQKYTTTDGKVDYDNAITDLLGKADSAKAGVATAGSNLASSIRNKFTRSPRELRQITDEAQGLFPRLGEVLKNRAIRRYSVNNPQPANQVGTRTGWLTGRTRPIYDQARSVNGRNLGRGETFTLPTSTPKKVLTNIKKNNFQITRAQRGVDTNRNPIYQYFATNNQTNSSFENVKELMNYLKSYKNGGKIRKLQSGGRYPWGAPLDPNDPAYFEMDALNPDFGKFYHAPILGQGQTRTSTPTVKSTPSKAISQTKPQQTFTAPQLESLAKTVSANAVQAPVRALDPSTIQLARPVSTTALGTTNPSIGGDVRRGKSGYFRNLPKLNINRDDALSVLGLGLAQIFNRRAYKAQDRALQEAMKADITSPQEFYPRFTDYGVNDAYNQAARRQLSVKPATSDYLTANAIEQNAKNRASQLELEGRLKTSELFSNYLNTTDELRRNYAGVRNDVANQNRQRIAQLQMARGNLKAGKITNDFTSLNNFILEKRHQLAEDKQKFEGYNDVVARSNADQAYQEKIEQMFSPYRQQFLNLSAEEQAQYGNWENYLRITNPDEYNRITKSAQQQQIKSLIPYFNTNLRWNKIQGYAKGGKTSKSKSLNAAEQIWVNQNKDAAKAVQLLNESVLKLFLKATS